MLRLLVLHIDRSHIRSETEQVRIEQDKGRTKKAADDKVLAQRVLQPLLVLPRVVVLVLMVLRRPCAEGEHPSHGRDERGVEEGVPRTGGRARPSTLGVFLRSCSCSWLCLMLTLAL